MKDDSVTKRHGERLGYPEEEAAGLLGLKRHNLRDARYRGEVNASKVGKRIIYRPADLEALIERNRVTR